MRPQFSHASIPAFPAATEYKSYTRPNGTQGTKSEQGQESFSSATALIIVLILLFSLITLSLATYCFHKSKLRNKRLQKAHEEYQRDHGKSGFQGTSGLIS